MTLKGGTTLACAACKYQRRKCTPECLLAPYFPADRPKVFLNVHKLFGVSNIVKLLKKLDPSQKKTATDSLIAQANFREKYPVHGCWEEVCRLRYRIWQMEEELQVVHQRLEMCRQQQQQHYHHHQGQCMHDHGDVTSSQLELGMAPCSANAHPLVNVQQPQPYNNTLAALPVVSQQQQQYPYSNSSSAPFNPLYVDSRDNVTNPLWVQHPYEDHSGNSMMQPQFVATQPIPVLHGVGEEYDEMHPFYTTTDDRHSFIYSKEAYESSSEESLRDTRKCIEHVAENELKSAAACFSLTSVS